MRIGKDNLPEKKGNPAVFVIKNTKTGKKLFASSEALKKFFHTASDLNPEFWVDQLFKDVFHTFPPIAEDLPPVEQNERLKARLMMQDLFIGIFSSMELKGGHK